MVTYEKKLNRSWWIVGGGLLVLVAILLVGLFFMSDHNMEIQTESSTEKTSPLSESLEEQSAPASETNLGQASSDFLERVREATGPEARERENQRQVLRHVMPRRRPSGAMMQHGQINHSGTLLEHYLKQGKPPTEEELEKLYQMYLAEEDGLSFMLTYINTQSDWDLWKKANPAEREALQKRKEIKDLFFEVADSMGWQTQDEFAHRLFTSDEEESHRQIMEQMDRDKEIMEDKEMSAKEREVALVANFLGSYEAAELSSIVRRDLVYYPNAENLRLLADYLREQRTEAQNTLVQGYENSIEWWREREEWTQWWKDRFEWIEESADKLQLSLDPTDTSWTEDAVAYHQSLIDERQEIRKRLLGNLSSSASPENILRNEKFFDEYMMGDKKIPKELFRQVINQFFPTTEAAGDGE